MIKSNMLIIHGGAPTAVMNASLFGAITEGKKSNKVNKIYGALGGTGGLLKENFISLDDLPSEKLNKLPFSPASAIGTSRDLLTPDDYAKMVEIFIKNNIKYILINGGNGSMDTCGKIKKACENKDIFVAGIPKTIDNDLAVTDHSPGYGSAAKYIAATTNEISEDIKSLPIHVSILETMGRNAGWIAAASALSEKNPPDLIYVPERAFDEEKFLEDVEKIHAKKGGVLVVVSEGIKDKNGELIAEPIFQVDRSVYYGDVSSKLSNMIIKKLGIKARNEKPGICGRASIAFQSEIDRNEAIAAAKTATLAVLSEKTGVMSGFSRNKINYEVSNILIPIEEVMLHEKLLPDEFISKEGNNVTPEFINWARPLLGSKLTEFVSL